MNINNVEFGTDCLDIIKELQDQLHINNIPLIAKIIDTPNNVQICCHYHKGGAERRPSAGIKKSVGTFHCLACGEVHTLPEVISYCFGHRTDIFGSFGWQWLLRNFATVSVEERHEIDLDFRRPNRHDSVGDNAISISSSRNSSTDTVDNRDNILENTISEEELDEYRYFHPYWKKRGIVDERVIDLFDLGYDKRTDCITFPIRDIRGTTVFVARRSVKTKYFNYPKDVSKPLYGLYEYNHIRNRTEIVCPGRGCGKTQMLMGKMLNLTQVFICESMIDALLLWQYGYYAFALNGLGSSSQLEELKKQSNIRKYILCTDNDKAGEKARTVLRNALRNKLLTEIRFPQNRKDVGECTPEEIKNILQWEVL